MSRRQNWHLSYNIGPALSFLSIVQMWEVGVSCGTDKERGREGRGGIGVQQLLKPLFASFASVCCRIHPAREPGQHCPCSFGRDDRTPPSQHHIISLLVKRGNYCLQPGHDVPGEGRDPGLYGVRHQNHRLHDQLVSSKEACCLSAATADLLVRTGHWLWRWFSFLRSDQRSVVPSNSQYWDIEPLTFSSIDLAEVSVNPPI